MRKIHLYYDCVSPYSWLAFEFLVRHQKIWNYELILKPMYLGAVMKASENTPPGLNRLKAKFMIKDLERSGKIYGFDIKQHPDFPTLMFQSLNFMRLISSVQLYCPQMLETCSRKIWQRLWQNQQDVSQNSYEQILEGIEPSLKEKIIKGANDQKVRDNLKYNTDECIALGSFGAPTYLVKIGDNKEWFIGSDRWEQLAFLLGAKYEGQKPKL